MLSVIKLYTDNVPPKHVFSTCIWRLEGNFPKCGSLNNRVLINVFKCSALQFTVFQVFFNKMYYFSI